MISAFLARENLTRELDEEDTLNFGADTYLKVDTCPRQELIRRFKSKM